MSPSSNRPPKQVLSDADISYVTDHEQDAHILSRQTGRPVMVRRWILEEYPYHHPRPARERRVSRTPRRPGRLRP